MLSSLYLEWTRSAAKVKKIMMQNVLEFHALLSGTKYQCRSNMMLFRAL